MFEWIGNKVVEFLAPRAATAVIENLPTVIQVGASAYSIGTATNKVIKQAVVAVDKVRKIGGDVVASVAGGDPVGAVKAAQEAAEAKVAELVIREAKARLAKFVPIVAVIIVFLIVRSRRS